MPYGRPREHWLLHFGDSWLTACMHQLRAWYQMSITSNAKCSTNPISSSSSRPYFVCNKAKWKIVVLFLILITQTAARQESLQIYVHKVLDKNKTCCIGFSACANLKPKTVRKQVTTKMCCLIWQCHSTITLDQLLGFFTWGHLDGKTNYHPVWPLGTSIIVAFAVHHCLTTQLLLLVTMSSIIWVKTSAGTRLLLQFCLHYLQ